jgi:fatty acyl-CoA reductase
MDFVLSKITVVSGNLEVSELGIAHGEELRQIQREVDVVINCAGSTTFDGRLDESLNTNTLGALRVLQFTKQCSKAQLLVHISTAYVNGKRVGYIPEIPLKPGDCIAKELQGGGWAPELDLDYEISTGMASAESFRKAAIARGVDPKKTEAVVEERMKALGMKQANQFGWHNTYTFTKALGEMLLWRERGDLPVAVG